MEFYQFMTAMMSAPFDKDKCDDCGGLGLKQVICCNGFECGCRGMPIDFTECGCGCDIVSEEMLLSLLPATCQDLVDIGLKS